MTPEGPPPEELLARFREQGEVDALGALFDATSPTLFRMALALAPDPASAEDAVQETFLTLMAPGSHYDPSRPLLPWMVGILQMKVHEARRRARRTVDPNRLAPPVFPDDPALAAENGEEVERIRSALDALPEPYRAVAILRWRYGLEPAAIADARNEPPGTIRSLLHRAREKLRGTLRVLPAFLAAGRVPRGMEAVRSTVMVKGTAAAAAAGVSVAAAVATGGLLMAPKMLVAAAVVLLLGGTAWFTFRPDLGRPVPPAPPTVAIVRPPVPPAPKMTEPPLVFPDPPRGPDPLDLPPPVDLSKCDRDLDLFGTTVDEFGRPVPGARIETVTYPLRQANSHSHDDYYREEVGLTTRSAVDGTFSIRLGRGDTVDLRATAEGYGQGDLPGCLAGERATVILRIGGATVALTVLDDDRNPVPGVIVTFAIRAANSLYGRISLARRGTTDERGRCDFTHLPGGKGFLTVEHRTLGNPDFLQPEVPAAGVLPLELLLYRGRTVSGRVTDASTGKPIPGALVGSNYYRERGVLTDSDGRFAVPGVTKAGSRGLGASAEGYGSQLRHIPDAGEADFALEPSFAATGRVVTSDGLPVPGALVAVSGFDKGKESWAYDGSSSIADNEGRFRVPDLSRRCADHFLLVESRGHARIAFVFRSPLEGEQEMDLGDVAMADARAIEGRALDPAGNPLAGADVFVGRLKGSTDPVSDDPRENIVQGSGVSRRTDDLGRFRFPDLSPGRWSVRLSVRSAPIVETVVLLPADQDVLDVVLCQTGSSLTFLVTDKEGNPIPGISIFSDMVFPNPSAVGASGSISAMTDAKGRVRFTAIPEVRLGSQKGFRFNVQPIVGDSAPPWTMVRTDPILPAGQEVHVVLQPVALIRGRVLGPGDEPVQQVSVTACDAAGKAVEGALAACDERGEFSLRVVAGSTVTLQISGSWTIPAGQKGASISGPTPWRAELQGVEAPAEGIVLRATRFSVEGTLDLVVLDLEGRPLADVHVNAWRTGDGRSGKTDGAGRVHWEGMVEAEWHVIALFGIPKDAPEDAVPPAAVDVVPKGQEVLLRLRRGIAVEGTVLLPDGTPAAGAILGYNLTGGGGGPARQPKSDDRGRFKLWFGEGDEFRIQATLTDGKGVVLRGETPDIRPGGGEVDIRLAPE